MRAGLLHILFLILTLLIVSSEQRNKKQTFGGISSCQSIILNNKDVCIVPEINLSHKKFFAELIFFRFISETIFENINRCKRDLSATYLKSYQTKTIDFKSIKQKPFRLTYYSPEKEDNHHLS
jgi:hypothetical protein